jgi:hypothetical protein
MKLGKPNKAKNFKRKEAKICSLFSIEHAKTKRNGSYFASFHFEAKKKPTHPTLEQCVEKSGISIISH